MSYARFLNSDVYVFVATDGYGRPCLDCCGCRRHSGGYVAYSTGDMIDHLRQHEQDGDEVPAGIYGELRADDPVNFPAP